MATPSSSKKRRRDDDDGGDDDEKSRKESESLRRQSVVESRVEADTDAHSYQRRAKRRNILSPRKSQQASAFFIRGARGAGIENAAVESLNGEYMEVYNEQMHEGYMFYEHCDGSGFAYVSDGGYWIVADSRYFHLMRSKTQASPSERPWDVIHWTVPNRKGIFVSCPTARIVRCSRTDSHRTDDAFSCDAISASEIEQNQEQRFASPGSAVLDPTHTTLRRVQTLMMSIVRNNTKEVAQKALRTIQLIIKNLRRLGENPKFGRIKAANKIFRNSVMSAKGGLSLIREIGFEQITFGGCNSADAEEYVFQGELSERKISEALRLARSAYRETLTDLVQCDVCKKYRKIDRDEVDESVFSDTTSTWRCVDLPRVGSCDAVDDEIFDIVENERYAQALEKSLGKPLTREKLAMTDPESVTNADDLILAIMSVCSAVPDDDVSLKIRAFQEAKAWIQIWIQKAQHAELGDLMREIVSPPEGSAERYDLDRTLEILQEMGVTTPQCFLQRTPRDFLREIRESGAWSGTRHPSAAAVEKWICSAKDCLKSKPWTNLWVSSSTCHNGKKSNISASDKVSINRIPRRPF